MKVKSRCVLLLFFLFSSTLFGSTRGKIVGHVKNAETKEPLVGVNVVIEGTTLGAATDLDGRFSIINIQSIT